jgi:hypothetical protein
MLCRNECVPESCVMRRPCPTRAVVKKEVYLLVSILKNRAVYKARVVTLYFTPHNSNLRSRVCLLPVSVALYTPALCFRLWKFETQYLAPNLWQC